jgi:hypothetical protein
LEFWESFLFQVKIKINCKNLKSFYKEGMGFFLFFFFFPFFANIWVSIHKIILLGNKNKWEGEIGFQPLKINESPQL